ncbi:L-methionine/branched-chain amino acid transporter [Amphritea sp. HPY]|uniref:L-methionine/branched-chain amino acid transporter n=1 Tax=Amphritea sp. HPY TaxID=3421652 RepID=UPI003D7C91AB
MTRLNQTITRWQGMGLIATTLLGTGVFILPQLTIAAAGDKAPLAWGLLLLAILPLALVFAELGRRYTHAAGPAYFVEQAYGKVAGRIIGLMFLFVVPLGAPAALIMTFEFLKPLIALTPQQAVIGELLVIAALFFANRRGLQLSGKVQLGLTLAILAVVVLMLGALFISPQPTMPVPVSVKSGSGHDVLAAIGLAIWSFLGIEAVTHLASEFKDVKRDFIPAILGGVTLVGLIFICCTYLSLLAPFDSLAMVGAFELLLGESGRWVIGLLGLVCGIATVNVYFASLARLAWSFSHDGALPACLKPLNKHNVPAAALLSFLLLSALILVACYLLDQDFPAIVRWVNGVFVLVYGAAMLAAWKLLPRRYRPAIAAGLAACFVFAYSLGSATAYALILVVVLAGWVLGQRYWQLREVSA